jgi:hypothetical protein
MLAAVMATAVLLVGGGDGGAAEDRGTYSTDEGSCGFSRWADRITRNILEISELLLEDWREL